tara:strand:- start:55 stop:201 length:147 start_codon:yes stop_codon:yes gene_type:complete
MKLLSFDYYDSLNALGIQWYHSKEEGFIEISLDSFNWLHENFEDWDNV